MTDDLMTGEEIARRIHDRLSPVFGHMMFRVRYLETFGHPTVHVTYASVPTDAPEIDALNAKRQLMISIDAPDLREMTKSAAVRLAKEYGKEVFRWEPGHAAPAEVTAKQFRGTRGLFRARTGPPKAIVDYVIRFFLDHREELLSSGGGGGAKASRSRGTVARFVDPHEPAGQRAFFNRWFGNKYGLSPAELDALWKCHRIDLLEQELDAWRQVYGWPSTNSPLARGKLVELVRSGRFT